MKQVWRHLHNGFVRGRVFMWLHYLVLYFCVYLGIFIRKTFGDLTTDTHTEECEKTNKNLVLNFIKASSLPRANWLLVLTWPLITLLGGLDNSLSQESHQSCLFSEQAQYMICCEGPPKPAVLNSLSIQVSSRTPQCFSGLHWAPGWAVSSCPPSSHAPPFLWFPSACHGRGQRRSLGWQKPTLWQSRWDVEFHEEDLWGLAVAGALQSRSEMAQAQSRAGTCAPSVGPEPLLSPPQLLWPSPPRAGAT